MLTVLFATRDRAATLARVLECFTRLQSPRGGWKLVVADNGSTDDTQAVLRRFDRRLPLEVVHARRPGKNAALNEALARADGDLCVQTDDDVLPRADWLTAYRAAADGRPDCLLFGGTVQPAWPEAAPDWLLRARRHHAILYASCAQPDGPCRTTDIFGPNWAVRSCVFRTGLRFDETIGPDNTKPFYPMGSETEFIGRLAEQGARAWFVAGAVVSHIVRPDQLSERWVLDRAYRNGLGVGITGRPRCLSGPRLGGVPVRLLAGRAAYRSLALLARPLPPSPLRLRVLFQERWLAGLATSVRANLSTSNENGRKNLAPARAFKPERWKREGQSMRTFLLTACSAVALTVAPALAQPTMPGLTYTQPLTTQAIQLIQQRLQQQSVYSGRADGIWGPDSQAALERFQQAHGLQVTGQINQATVATLGLPTDQLLAAGQVPAPTAAAEPPVVGATLSRNAVRSVQARLRELNYYHGAVDGVWGGSTQQAIERFQQGRALQVNGQLNPTTVSALGLSPDVFAR